MYTQALLYTRSNIRVHKKPTHTHRSFYNIFYIYNCSKLLFIIDLRASCSILCALLSNICVYNGFYVRQRSNNVRLRVLVHVDYDDRYIVEVLDNILGSCARPNNNHVYNNNKKSFSFMYVRMTSNLGSFLKHCTCMFGFFFFFTHLYAIYFLFLSLSLTLCHCIYDLLFEAFITIGDIRL